MARKLTTKAITNDAITADKIVAGAVVADIGTGTVTSTHLHSTLDLSTKTLTLPSLANLGTTGTKTTALNTAAHFLTLGLTVDDDTAYDNAGVGGGIAFRGKRNAGGVQTVYGAIDAGKEDAAGDQYKGHLRFYTNQNATGVPLERMRIDSSGNLVIGKTSANASGTVGFEYNNGGQLAVTRSGDTVALLNRNTSNGAILDFRRDNSLIGTIAGTIGLIVGTGDTGLGFQTSTGDAIIPQRPDTQAGSDNLLSFGNTSYRFKDMFLGGGLYVGGTGSANQLDYYEEGTWTPSFVGATNQGTHYNKVGRYTRIGRLVVIQFFYQVGATRPTFSNNSSAFFISGIPFSVASSGYTGSQGSVNAQAFNYNSTYNNQGMGADYLSASINGSEQLFFTTTNSGQTRGYVNNLSANSSHWIVEATVSYFTDA